MTPLPGQREDLAQCFNEVELRVRYFDPLITAGAPKLVIEKFACEGDQTIFTPEVLKLFPLCYYYSLTSRRVVSLIRKTSQAG
jgi:hypothetical protein